MFHCSRLNSYSVWMADVTAIVSDGIATNYYMADVIAIVADCIATNYFT